MAYVFHWPPSELDELDADDIRFWLDRLDEIKKAEEQQ